MLRVDQLCQRYKSRSLLKFVTTSGIIRVTRHFYNDSVQGINVIFLKKSKVEHNKHLLNQVAFSDVRTQNGIRMVHHMDFSNVTSLGLLLFFTFLFLSLSHSD